MEFNKSYTQYWESAVQKSVDGTVIAGLNEADHFLSPLGLSRSDRILDLGCSSGRMCAALTQYSDAVYGTEPDSYAVEKASAQPYLEVRQGTAEATGYPDGFFDFVFCWAVFDVVDHVDGLSEINRILKVGGRFLVTGKGDTYNPLDILAFNAEKNAYIKGFPNKFTDLSRLCSQIGAFGFEPTDLITFPCRGDMGLLHYKRQCIDEIVDVSSGAAIDGYEYLMVARKIGPSSVYLKEAIEPIDGPVSKTVKTLATNAGFTSVNDYLYSIGID
jgi:SAM-dependent methyltransferase